MVCVMGELKLIVISDSFFFLLSTFFLIFEIRELQ